MPHKEIVTELSSLSAKELKDIKGRINYILTNGTTNGGDKNKQHQIKEVRELLDKEESYFKNLIMLQSKRYVGFSASSGAIQNALDNDKYELDTKLNFIAKEIKSLVKVMNLTKREAPKFCRALMEAAVANMEEKGKPKVFTVLINFMKNPRLLLEESWPEYAGSEFWKRTVLK